MSGGHLGANRIVNGQPCIRVLRENLAYLRIFDRALGRLGEYLQWPAGTYPPVSKSLEEHRHILDDYGVPADLPQQA